MTPTPIKKTAHGASAGPPDIRRVSPTSPSVTAPPYPADAVHASARAAPIDGVSALRSIRPPSIGWNGSVFATPIAELMIRNCTSMSAPVESGRSPNQIKYPTTIQTTWAAGPARAVRSAARGPRACRESCASNEIGVSDNVPVPDAMAPAAQRWA